MCPALLFVSMFVEKIVGLWLKFILDYLWVWNTLFMTQILNQEWLEATVTVYYFLPHKQSSFLLHYRTDVNSTFFKLIVSCAAELAEKSTTLCIPS